MIFMCHVQGLRFDGTEHNRFRGDERREHSDDCADHYYFIHHPTQPIKYT